jgi:hypothetical protein
MATTSDVVYRSTRAIALRVAADRALIYVHDTAAVLDVSADLYAVWRLCDGARSIAAHAQAISRAHGVAECDVREAIATLVRLELLRPFTPVASSGSVSPSRIGTLGILTCDRPQMLWRALTDAVTQLADFGRDTRVVVVDGSRQYSNQAANRQIVRAQAGQIEGQLLYVGATEARGLTQGFGHRGFDSDILARAIATGTTGANRNLLLLLTAGQQVVMVDDDIRWDLWRLPVPEETIVDFGGHHELAQYSFFTTRDAARAATTPISTEMLAVHEGFLGKSLREIAALHQIDVSGACAHILEQLADEKSQSAVRVTQLGLAGDAASYCPYHVLFARPELRWQLASDETALEAALTSREVVKGYRRASVLHQSPCMAGCIGLANTAILPPFTSVGGNEDGVFGRMLRYVDDSSLFCHLPVGIVHDSPRTSPRETSRIRSAAQMRVSDLIVLLLPLAGGTVPSARVERRLLGVSAWFDELSRMPLTELQTLMVDLTAGHRRKLLATLESELLGGTTGSISLREAAQQFHSKALEAMADPESCVPVELYDGDVEQAWRRFQIVLSDYGALLGMWPELWRHARQDALVPSLKARTSSLGC